MDFPDLALVSQESTVPVDKILEIIRNRYQNVNNENGSSVYPYTRIGTKHLISMNPLQLVDVNDDSYMQKYIELYRQVNGKNDTSQQPHIYEMAMNCHFHMKQTGLNQSMVFMGESGSGKTECKRMALRILSYLRWYSKRDMKLYDRILEAETIIEAFSHAKTSHHANATRMGLYTELQFDKVGRIQGARFLDYMLDKSRVAKVGSGERNFHIFYYLLFGTSDKEKAEYGLNQIYYEYLSRPGSIQKLAGIDDSEQFNDLKAAMSGIGLGTKYSKMIFQTLAVILLLGNLQFENPKDSTAMETASKIKNIELAEHISNILGVDVHSFETTLTYRSQMVGRELCTIYLDSHKAEKQCDSLATLLYSLLSKWIIGKINGNLASLSDYKDSNESYSTISMLDIPGFQSTKKTKFDDFMYNYTNERIFHFMNHQVFEVGNLDFAKEGIDNLFNPVKFLDNTLCLDSFMKPETGFLPIIDKMTRHVAKKAIGINTKSYAELDMELISQFKGTRTKSETSDSNTKKPTDFTVKHFISNVDYSGAGFFEANNDSFAIDFVNLLKPENRYSSGEIAATNPFISNLFNELAILTEKNPRLNTEIISAHQVLLPANKPGNKNTNLVPRLNKPYCVVTMYQKALTELISNLDETLPWFVVSIKPNPGLEPNLWDNQYVGKQLEAFGVPQIADRKKTEFVISMMHTGFFKRYSKVIKELIPHINKEYSDLEVCESLQIKMGWKKTEMAIGKTKVFLNYGSWNKLEKLLTASLKSDQIHMNEKSNKDETDDTDGLLSIYSNDADSDYILDESNDPELQEIERIQYRINQAFKSAYDNNAFNQTRIEFVPEIDCISGDFNYTDSNIVNNQTERIDEGNDYMRDEKQKKEESPGNDKTPEGNNNSEKQQLRNRKKSKNKDQDKKVLEKKKKKQEMSKSRRFWLIMVWFVTWWVPSPILKFFAKLYQKEQRIAWREKFTLFVFILFVCGATIFWIAILGVMICPKQKVYTIEELRGYNTADNPLIAIRGEVFNIKDFNHANVDFQQLVNNNYPGKDLSDRFPLQLSYVCPGLDIDPRLSMSPKPEPFTDTWLHDHRFWKHPDMISGGGYNYYQYRVMRILRSKYFKGNIGIDRARIKLDGNGSGDTKEQRKYWGVINQEVFDLTDYINHRGAPYIVSPEGVSNDTTSREFLDEGIRSMFELYTGTDLTERWDLYFSKTPDKKSIYHNCLKSVFFAGIVDHRKSLQCYFANYILLSSSILLTSIILFKFLAALQLGSKREPEEHDKFVVCNVPCYTEGEDSLKLTLESLAKLHYDDKRKLLFVICDGMIMGSGNDRPTPRIVLDVLGADPDLDPEPLSFLSLGEGNKQHNMGKVYSGLYEVGGHVVPYLVLVKCGTPKEKVKQGNRGKRDSQIILMKFFSKVHFDLEMTPLELEIYHQIKNVIGVDPMLYEFVMMVDADTYVFPDSMNRMVSCMIHDSKLMGICGETMLANEKETWVTMIQVYEYYISHHLSKAFESLFGSVTCLPGCFCMYRIRSPEKNQPLLINPVIIGEYAENNVNTLHKKNLLHLGEDRYLTTLMLKHLPYYKMKFTPDAQCRTNAPNTWEILLSQRRRWINSTVHNLLELVILPRLCGFCCFSMRFIVFIDLLSTIIMPATVAYLIYLFYVLATWTSDIPVVSICLLVSVYAMQVILFIVKRQWQHIGWMVVYMFAIPVFSFFIPLYSFWHFDDFTWGNTRKVVGDGKNQNHTLEDEEFDPSLIPTKKWAEYEADAMDEIRTNRAQQDDTFSLASSKRIGATQTRPQSPALSFYSNNQYGYHNNNNSIMIMPSGYSHVYTQSNDHLQQRYPQQGGPIGVGYQFNGQYNVSRPGSPALGVLPTMPVPMQMPMVGQDIMHNPLHMNMPAPGMISPSFATNSGMGNMPVANGYSSLTSFQPGYNVPLAQPGYGMNYYSNSMGNMMSRVVYDGREMMSGVGQGIYAGVQNHSNGQMMSMERREVEGYNGEGTQFRAYDDREVGVYLSEGATPGFIVNIGLTTLGYLPGLIHALYLMNKDESQQYEALVNSEPTRDGENSIVYVDEETNEADLEEERLGPEQEVDGETTNVGDNEYEAIP
ncbi:hypothetical protein BB558_003972 [Smittium angustum]|uniref:chitin synthase n=1 Tax=Smittium angustum TaxID=133377 RepID=A0A2U1J4N3_SMIAN|nr:hypothetical protein BB558_003972 [Smittium angustum]